MNTDDNQGPLLPKKQSSIPEADTDAQALDKVSELTLSDIDSADVADGITNTDDLDVKIQPSTGEITAEKDLETHVPEDVVEDIENSVAPVKIQAATDIDETDDVDDVETVVEKAPVEARPSRIVKQKPSKREAKRLARYADIRREQYEALNELLETFTHVDDLNDERLEQIRDAIFHADHPFLLTLVGPFSSGKSSVINALLGEAVLDVGPVPTTDHISILRYGPTVQKSRTGTVSTVFYPAELLERISLVDTPGLESVFKQHDDLTKKFLHRADILFLVMIATQVLTASDLAFMQSLKEYGKRTVIVVNQIDVLEPEDRETVRAFVEEQSRLHMGIEPQIWLVSAKQALTAYTSSTLRDEIIWDESGFADVEEYLFETLDDAQRIYQKLDTPLQIAQNVNREAIALVQGSVSALNEHRKTVDNMDAQINASERERERILEKTLTEIEDVWTEATARGNDAIDELFQGSRAIGQAFAGMFEIIGLGAIMRRFRKRTQGQEAFAKYEVRESLQRIPEITNKLGPALEGRDQEEIDQLVEYTRQQMQQLPENLRNKVIGKVQSPMRYDRKSLRTIRGDLDDIIAKAGQFETAKLDRALRGTVVTMAFWMFIVIVVGILIGTGAILSGNGGLLNLILILCMAIFGLTMLPIRGWMLRQNYRGRMAEFNTRYTNLLDRAGHEQIKYGTQLRRDVTSPFTRLVSTQTELTDELKDELDAHQHKMISIQHKLSGLLKD